MAKRKNNIDDIDIVDDFELEDIDDFDPFDVLDDSYEDKKSYGNDKPRGGNASNKRNKNKKKNPVLVWAGRVGATLLSTILILVIFLYAVMAMLVYGPSKTAKIQFVLSVQETSAIGFLANWFCSQDEIDQIKANNAIKDTDEITDAGLVNIDTAAQDPETPDIEIVDVKGATYSGKLMIVKDPSRLFVGTVPEFTNGNGMVVADIAKRYDAIGGVNGGEFVDGLRDMGAYIQMNADSIIGEDGFMIKRFCKKVIKEEMLDFVGSDGHDLAKRTPHIGKCYDKIEKMMGTDYADMIFISNPECIINNERF